MNRPALLLASLFLAALIAAGCNKRQPPAEVRTAAKALAPVVERTTSRIDQIDAALAGAAKYLADRQAADGSWPSDVYGPFKSGDALAALVLTTLLELQQSPDDPLYRAHVDNATQYLVAMIDEHGRVKPPAGGLAYPVYTSAGAVIALSRQGDPGLRAARDAWLDYLRERQLTEPLDWHASDPAYGGWGYAGLPPRKPADGQPLGDPAQPNLSATVFALTALRAAGVAADDPAVQKALVFVRRCQNFAEDRDAPDPAFDDGGFHFIQGDPVRNKAGVAGADQAGRTRFRSYGSATADGLQALALYGTAHDEQRLAAAWQWTTSHFAADAHPGDYAPDRKSAQPAVYYYYCHSLLEAVAAANSGGPAPANTTRWAAAIADALLARQRPDASWKNPAVDVREDDPLIATSLAASALARCRKLLEEPTGAALAK